MTSKPIAPSLLQAFIPLLLLIALLGLNIVLFSVDATYGPNQIALLIAAFVAAWMGLKMGYSYNQILEGVTESIKSAMGAILILFMIGALSGTWLISGIIPTLIYYGLDILNPQIFLFAACVISALVSVATGSSWSTIATVGLALLGIGKVLGISEGMIAGAIISGAYFGDKMSPLSDTTNLAPAMAGTDLFTHIRYMTYTTFPTLAVTLIIFLIIGFTMDTSVSSVSVAEMSNALSDKFYIHPWLLIVPVIVVVLIIKKVDAIPALLIASVLGGILAVVAQPQIIAELAHTTKNYAWQSYEVVVNAMGNEVNLEANNPLISQLLVSRGMAGMMNTVWLIIAAMTFGGVLEVTGILAKISRTIISFAHSAGSMIASTVATCLFFNVTASDQYLAIVVPGRMYADAYRERGLAPENLSRTLEDSGTVTSVLIPWNTCGATQSTVLQVATGEYWMYCFFNLLSPITTMIYGFFNIRIRRIPQPE